MVTLQKNLNNLLCALKGKEPVETWCRNEPRTVQACIPSDLQSDLPIIAGTRPPSGNVKVGGCGLPCTSRKSRWLK